MTATKTTKGASRRGGSEDERISIGQLASEAGVSTRTIRYYEELGILPEPPRSAAGTRKYPRDWVFYLEGALALKELGFTLEEMGLIGRIALGKPITKREREQASAVVTEKMQALEHRIRVLGRLREILRGIPGGREPKLGPEGFAGLLSQGQAR